MSKIKFSDWWDKVGSKTKPCDYHGRLSHAERMAEMAWDAAIKNSAAPELLEALNRMLVKFESEIIAEYEGTALLSERLKEADFARAAIAKAEGRDA